MKIKNKKDKSLKKKLKHESNIVEITHMCIRHGVHSSCFVLKETCGPVGTICTYSSAQVSEYKPCIPLLRIKKESYTLVSRI
jgi:hypothetical protein